MFPKIIHICDKTTEFIEKYSKEIWHRLNPDYEIRLYDNHMCSEFLLETFGQKYVDIFNYIQDGPIKADFWRVCILYVHGGVYTDADNLPLIPLKDFIEPNVDFVTCSSFWFKSTNKSFQMFEHNEDKYKFNPNLIICKPGDPLMKNAINWYIHKYTMKHVYSYWDWSIMGCLTNVLHLSKYAGLDGVYELGKRRIQIIRELQGKTRYHDCNVYKGKLCFYNRMQTWDIKTHSFTK
jgi:mannosyltransferase OCH1-like enzyme